jgi:hypothetical protein
VDELVIEIATGTLQVTEELRLKLALGKLLVTVTKEGIVTLAKHPFASATLNTGEYVPAEE